MRFLRYVVSVICRGEIQRNTIMQLFARFPDREFTTGEIVSFTRSWAGPVHGDLIILHRRGHLHVRTDRQGTRYYQLNKSSDYMGVAALFEPSIHRGW